MTPYTTLVLPVVVEFSQVHSTPASELKHRKTVAVMQATTVMLTMETSRWRPLPRSLEAWLATVPPQPSARTQTASTCACMFLSAHSICRYVKVDASTSSPTTDEEPQCNKDVSPPFYSPSIDLQMHSKEQQKLRPKARALLSVHSILSRYGSHP